MVGSKIVFLDEGNVDFTAEGVGSSTTPLLVSADAHPTMADLSDVTDAVPADGDTLVWQSDHWEYGAPTAGSGVPPGGTDGQVLTKQSATDGDADWETPTGGGGGAVLEPPIRAAYWRSAALASVISTTALVWDTAERTAEGITYNSSTGDFTVAKTGWYLITSRLRLVSTSATGQATQFRLLVNGVLYDFTADNITTAPSSMVLSRQVYLNAADIITMHLSSGGAGVSLSVSTSKANSVEVSRLDQSVAPGGGGVVVERPIATSRQHATAIPAVANGTTVNIPWDTAQADDGSIPCSSGIFTIPVDGWYQINAKVTFPFNATGQRSVRVMRNGSSADMGIVQTATVPVANATTVQYARALKLTAGDAISVSASQSSGGALDVAYGGVSYNSVDITKMPQSFSGSAVSTYGERNYSASRRQAAAVSCTNGTVVTVPWDTEDYTDGIAFAGGIFTVPVAGYYQVTAKVAWDANGAGYRRLRIGMSGSSAVPGYNFVSPTANGQATNILTRTVKMAAGDTIAVQIDQGSGVTLATGASTANNSIDITKVPAPVINGAAASGVWGVAPLDKYGADSLIGRPVYIDSKGQLRAEPLAAARVSRLKSAVQTLTTASTYYTLTYETTEEADSGITYAAGVFTFTVAGVYQVNAVQHFASLSGDPQLRLSFMVNGVNYGFAVSGGTSPSNSQSLALSRSWRFAAGDTLSIQAFSTQAAQNAYGNASARYSFIDITRIAA